MAQDSNLADLVSEIRRVATDIAQGDNKFSKRMDAFEESLNTLFKKMQRPGAELTNDNVDERKAAIELCIVKHQLSAPKSAADDYAPSPGDIDNAVLYNKALHLLFRQGDPAQLEPTYKKALTSFSLGSNGFILPPQMSSTVLSCIADPTDLGGIMGHEITSGGSLKFLIDNARMQDSAWQCETNCFANSPQQDLAEGLAELEIKCETLRHVVCAGSDLLADSSFNIEGWILQKVSQGFRNTINNAVAAGDGIGKPLGILHPNSALPILDTSPSTPTGQFTWQDLIQLKWDLPAQWHTQGSAYLMNQKTFALVLTMSDALGRPLMIDNPTQGGQFLLNGSPIIVASQFPDALPGNTPVAFGNWQMAYTVVTRTATSMLVDPYSAGWCQLFKFETRVGGAPTCPNAARLLRIR